MNAHTISVKIAGLKRRQSVAQYVKAILSPGGELSDAAEIINAHLGTQYPSHRLTEWVDGKRPAPRKVLAFIDGFMED